LPKVSVIMPAYNSSKTIGATIDSVLKQTYGDYEIIVIDDGSKDDTAAIVEGKAASDDRIKFYKNEKNIGVSDTRNRAISLSSGEWIAFLDSDDLWREDKLERQLKLASESNADIIYSSYAMIDIDGNKKCNDFIVDEHTNFKKMLVRNEIGCLTVLVKRSAIADFKFMGEFAHEDYVLWLSLLEDGYTAIGDKKVLAEYRVYPGTRSYNKFRAAKNRWLVYRKKLKMPLFKSCVTMLKYVLVTLKKYKAAK